MGFFSKVWSGVKDVAEFVLDATITVYTGGANIWGDKAWTWFKHMLIPDMRRDREAMVNSATSTRRIVYGRTRVGGNLVYAETSGGANEYLNIIVVFTGHAITGYDEIWFNDQLAATVSGGVVTVTAAFAGFLSVELHDGTQTAASAAMLAQTHGNWTDDHKLIGCAYGYFRLKYDEAKYAAGIPAVKAVLRGKPVYDPRTATAGWSDNPALCVSDYMLMPGTIGGMGCSADEVPTDSVITAANICDQTIPGADNEKRYTLNGFISLDQTPANILKPMLSAMSGQALYSGGEWTIYAGAPAATVATLDESWLNGGISFSTGSNKGDLINTAKGTFTNPADHWADTEFPTVINEAYLDADYEELTADLPMPFTTSQTMAQRLATIEIEKSRRGMVVNYPCNLKAAHLDVMDCVAINNNRLGWVGKLFRIMSWGFSPTGGIDLALVEDDAGIWADPSTYGVLAPPPLTNLPDPWTVDNPAGLTVVESLHIGNVPSVIMSMATFSWTAGGASSRVFDVFLDGAIYATNYTDTTIDMPNMSTGLHSFAVRASNSLGTQSDTISVSATLYGKSLPPGNVSGFSGTLTRGQMLLTWLPTGDLDISGYEIQTGTVWDDAGNVKLIQDYSGTSYPWTPTESGDITLLIKAIDTSGNYSIAPASVTVAVPIPTQVAFSAITEGLYATNTPGDIKSKAVASWSGGGANVAGYDVEIWGPTDSAWSPQGNVSTPTFTIYDVTPGYWKIQVRAVNDYGLAGPWMETQATLLGKTAPPGSVTGLQAEIVSGQMRIYWDANPELDVSSYEIQIGTTWDGAGNLHLIQQYSGTSYLWTPNSSGTITILAKAIDTTGNFSVNAASTVYTVVAPVAVSSLTQNVIDNIVELRWSPATMGTFPVSYYELSKGNTFATAELIGRIYSTFNTLAETAAGSYKYWIVAVDTVGLRSAETGVYTVVSQPPDYILVDNQNLVLSSCTLSNAIVENDALILPVNTSITFANHFISNPDTTLEPWATPQDQINDGYPVYAQPGPTASSITKIIDYGTLLPPANITMNVTRNTVAGNPVITPEMFISPDGTTYTSLGSGLYSVMAPAAFRYVKYVLAVGSAANDGALIQVTGINVKLDVKQRSSTTTVNVTDTVGDGTQVLFSSMQIAPVDVLGITANAPYYGNANDPVTALINFVDTPYPTSFKVLAWNKAGTRISAAGVVVTVKYI